MCKIFNINPARPEPVTMQYAYMYTTGSFIYIVQSCLQHSIDLNTLYFMF